MGQINLDALMADLKVELQENYMMLPPKTIEKRSMSIALRDFNLRMVTTNFIRFVNRFCEERNLVWFIEFDSQAIIIG